MQPIVSLGWPRRSTGSSFSSIMLLDNPPVNISFMMVPLSLHVEVNLWTSCGSLCPQFNHTMHRALSVGALDVRIRLHVYDNLPSDSRVLLTVEAPLQCRPIRATFTNIWKLSLGLSLELGWERRASVLSYLSGSLYNSLNGWMNKWMYEWKWITEWINKWIDEWVTFLSFI